MLAEQKIIIEIQNSTVEKKLLQYPKLLRITIYHILTAASALS